MSEVTLILSRIESGDPGAAEQLLPLVYQELRKLAAAKFVQERPGQTLQATALVHEAYLQLIDGQREQISPGLSPGQIDLHGNYAQTSAGDFDVEIGGYVAGTQYDRLNVNGPVAIAGSLTLNLTDSFVPVDGDLFTVIDNHSTDPVIGTFDGLPEGTIFSIPGGNQFKISYNGFGTGDDVIVMAINRPPIANAGGPYMIEEGGSLSLDGSGSYDPDPLDTLT